MADSSKIITLQNIDDEDFTFEYNSSEGNHPYLIAAGDTARFPEFLAKHALKHLTDKILNKRGERTNNQTLRLEIADQIIIDTEKVSRAKELTKTEKLKKEVDGLNRPSALDVILSKRKAEKEHVQKAKEKEGKEGEVVEEFEGLKKHKAAPPYIPETKKKVEPKEVKAKPTRAEVIEYAKTKMNIVIDEKTEKKFKAMKLEDLMKEVQYE